MFGGFALAHLDADCFYVSAKRVRDPFLIGKPVGVLGNQGACVIAKSYEMKASGVKTGTAIWDAFRLCPHGIYIKRDFRWYEVLSRRLLELVRAFSPRVEYYSIEEFFFEVPHDSRQSLQEAITLLRDRALVEVGVPVTVGVGRTRTLAKLISDTAKPFGALALLDPSDERELMARLPVTEISGIASRRGKRLEPVGMRTCLDLARADRRRVRELLTHTGEALWYELNGERVLPLQTERPLHRMLSRGGSLGEVTADPARVQAWLVRNLERLIEELEWHAVQTSRLHLYISHKDGTARGDHVPLDAPTDRFDLLLAAAGPVLKRVWVPGLAASRMHVMASGLCRPGSVQLGLFDPPAERARALARVKREINAEIGRFALGSGATLPLRDVYRDDAQGYDICDVRGKICF